MSETFARHREVETSFRFSGQLRGRLGASAACFIEYMLIKAHPTLAEEFLTKMATWEDLKRDDPIMVLLKLLEKRYLRVRRATGAPSGPDIQTGSDVPITQAALVIQAWNAWVKGEKKPRLNWSKEEVFPEIIVPETLA